MQKDLRLFSRLALITIVAVYFLILVGASVRATGAGMGCPDWPLCFGQVVPPMSEAQLPPDWRVTYADRGYDTAPFDPVKTWTEYLNRLTGVVIGLLSIATAVASWRLRRIDPLIPIGAIGGLLMVCFNGWVGSQVVASNLRPVMISMHMLGAFFVQMFLILALVRARAQEASEFAAGLPSWMPRLVLISLVALTLQIFLGIQIRESVDVISRLTTEVNRDEWIEHVPWIFYIHRSYSWVILLLVVSILWRVMVHARRIHSGEGSSALRGVLKVTVGLVAFEMLLGGALNHLGFPLLAQPVHLLTAHLIFGALWQVWVMGYVARRMKAQAVQSPFSGSQSRPVAATAAPM